DPALAMQAHAGGSAISRSCSSRERVRLERETYDAGKVCEELSLGRDLDGVHAHFAGGLQVDAEIVEIDAGLGSHAERIAHHLVDARVRLADAGLRAFDHMVE